MQLAIAQAELARGQTGDNPWVGCAIVDAQGRVLGLGFTRGPGEHHAEISAAEDAASHGYSIVNATLYSTLEPCSFHGRTPACAHAIVARGLRHVVVAIRDPNPRVDGVGLQILRDAGVEVTEGVAGAEVRIQLGSWIVAHHPHTIVRDAASSPDLPRAALLAKLAARYGVAESAIAALLAPA
jgi:diaminohydroxyphosphoribosylaminopyrimidine deaminase/5-amino-6-(5-phosphoribosylamino)uracil reductase